MAEVIEIFPYGLQGVTYLTPHESMAWLTHHPLDKMAAILADGIFKHIFTNENVRISIQISLKLFLRVQLTISQHWLR